jgi:hypothetical protein
MEELKPLIKYGWLRALIYFVVAIFLMLVLPMAGAELLSQLGLSGKSEEETPLNFAIIYTIAGAGIYLATYFFRRFIDRRSFESLGFTWKGFTDEAALGFFMAIALLGIGSLILVGLGYLTFLSIGADGAVLAIELALMIVVAFIEELLFRGYVLNNLLQSMNKWVALAISAAVFALVHGANPDVTVLAVVNVFLGGLLLGLNYIYTRNLWFSIFFHFAWNFFQGPILGYDVSGLKMQSLFHQSLTGPGLWTGGPFGFEGSLLCPLLLTASIVGLVYGFSRKYGTATLHNSP